MNASLYSLPAQNRVAMFAYEKMKKEYARKEAEMFHRVVSAQKSVVNNFFISTKTIRPDLKISVDSIGLTFHSDKFPCKYIATKDIASFNLETRQLNIRRKGSAKVTKVIKFRREVSPEKLIKYIERFAEK
jgi:hypothetical protein